MMLLMAKAGKGKQGGGSGDPNMRILYRQPYPGVPVVETYQQRNEGDVLLGYIVEGPLPQTGQKQRTGPIRMVVGMAVNKASGSKGSSSTVQRPLFGPPASMQPGPTGQVYVQGQPYYMEA